MRRLLMSKELFFNMRAEEMALMYDEDFSKKKAIEQGKKLVDAIYNDGLAEPIKVFSNIVRLKEVINSADREFRDRLHIVSKETYNGVGFTPMKPNHSLRYEEDPVYMEIKAKLEIRKALLDLAHKSKESIPDPDGCEVPKVSSKYSNLSIKIEF
jgi:hypothetical protein